MVFSFIQVFFVSLEVFQHFLCMSFASTCYLYCKVVYFAAVVVIALINKVFFTTSSTLLYLYMKVYNSSD